MAAEEEMSTTTFVTVTPRSSGGLVHITSLTDSHRTICRRICSGWRVSTDIVDCDACRAGVHMPVKRRRRRKA